MRLLEIVLLSFGIVVCFLAHLAGSIHTMAGRSGLGETVGLMLGGLLGALALAAVLGGVLAGFPR